MWRYSYKNKSDLAPFKAHRLEPGQGIVGYEMDETFGWSREPLKVNQQPEGFLCDVAALWRALNGKRDN